MRPNVDTREIVRRSTGTITTSRGRTSSRRPTHTHAHTQTPVFSEGHDGTRGLLEACLDATFKLRSRRSWASRTKSVESVGMASHRVPRSSGNGKKISVALSPRSMQQTRPRRSFQENLALNVPDPDLMLLICAYLNQHFSTIIRGAETEVIAN